MDKSFSSNLDGWNLCWVHNESKVSGFIWVGKADILVPPPYIALDVLHLLKTPYKTKANSIACQREQSARSSGRSQGHPRRPYGGWITSIVSLRAVYRSRLLFMCRYLAKHGRTISALWFKRAAIGGGRRRRKRTNLRGDEHTSAVPFIAVIRASSTWCFADADLIWWGVSCYQKH